MRDADVEFSFEGRGFAGHELNSCQAIGPRKVLRRRSTKRSWATALTTVVLLGCQQPAAAANLWGQLEAGPFDVGLNWVTYIDSTRVDPQSAPTTGGRPIEAAVWYPASSGKGQDRLQFVDYLRFLPELGEASQGQAFQKWLAEAISGDASAVERGTLEQILESPMRARRNASPAPGAFPLVLWTMRHGTVVAQSVLCEYLASHGYVVAAARFAGPALPRPWALKTEQEKQATFATHLRDLGFALDSLEKEPNIDGSRVAIMTWSYAAELALRMQLEHANVRLVIGLSSNPLSPAGLYQGTNAASYLDAEKLTVPYVVMTERIAPNGQERTAPTILAQSAAESYFVVFPDLAHGSFNFVEGMLPGVWGIERVQAWSRGGAIAQTGYETISRSVRAFLDYFLAAGTAPKQLDRSWKKELPPGFVTVTQYR